MTNPIPQDELIALLEKVGISVKYESNPYNEELDAYIDSHTGLDDFTKLAQLIQQRGQQQSGDRTIPEVGYVHLEPDDFSSSYDVRFYQPVEMGTKLYLAPPTEKSIRREALETAKQICADRHLYTGYDCEQAIHALIDQDTEGREEYEQMKADAERYRFIRNPGFSLVGIVDGDMRLIEENEADSIIDEIIGNKK